MLTDSIKTLSATPPPEHRLWRFKTIRTAHAEVNRLEAALGLPQSGIGQFGFNVTRANQKIVDLESMLAVKAAAPNTPRTAMAAPPASDAITFAKWRTMSADDQKSFCRDGGQMQRDSFLNEMPPAAQTHFLKCGGKLWTPPEPVAPTPSGFTSRAEFFALTPKEQTSFFQNGGKLSPI
jgi:hypothetical protein